MMRDAITSFHQQFEFKPIVAFSEKLKKKTAFVVAGMGGSNLATELIRCCVPTADILLHRTYGLPAFGKLKDRLIIANSLSGNTEETLDAAYSAHKDGLALAVIASGGKLLAFAKKHGVPYSAIPATGIQPRMAIGYTVRALLAVMGLHKEFVQSSRLFTTLKPLQSERSGKLLAQKLRGSIPVVYASHRYAGLAYNWKVAFNETGKIPAFYNVISEMNHTEMTGFDVQPKTKKLSRGFSFIVLRNPEDHPRILKRMSVLHKLYAKRGLPVTELALSGETVYEKVFSSFVLAQWVAFYTALQYGVEPEQVPMVEQFKRLIA